MALTKQNHRLEQVAFSFDDAGAVSDVQITVNYALVDDATGEEETRVRKAKSVWESLSDKEKTALGAIGKRLKALAETL